jgi:hypothetical protein
MRGVKFNVPVSPYGAGDTALLPDGAAQAVIDSGEAQPYAFPADPHAHEAGYQSPTAKPFEAPSVSRRDNKFTIKRK